jgi:hypothetical protein
MQKDLTIKIHDIRPCVIEKGLTPDGRDDEAGAMVAVLGVEPSVVPE